MVAQGFDSLGSSESKPNTMKINYTKWTGKYCTPHLSVIPSETYTQISFVILNHHWWIIINEKQTK